MNLLKNATVGISAAVIMFYVFSLAGGLILKLTPVSESSGYIYLIAMMCLVCFLNCVYIASKTGAVGFITGAWASAVIVIVIFISSSLLFVTDMETGRILRLEYLIPILSGTLGGIIGANIKK